MIMGKYNFFNSNSYSMHTQIVKFVDYKKKVLDVGCAEGNLAEVLAANESEIIGIEIDQIAAKKAQKFCNKVIIGDIESIELSTVYDNYFDYILFADVLEHLKDPLIVLQRFKKYLNKDGYILVSLPNISNWRMRLKILFGNFEYEDRGILDNGHIRFFNEKSAKKLIKNAGFEIIKFELTVGDLPLGSKFFHFIGTLWPNLMAYQFLIIAKK
jgi:2-polyprenyl-3-methyl-5-hydroxy-6-metoxy-1,4-benzoquinol methylase